MKYIRLFNPVPNVLYKVIRPVRLATTCPCLRLCCLELLSKIWLCHASWDFAILGTFSSLDRKKFLSLEPYLIVAGTILELN